MLLVAASYSLPHVSCSFKLANIPKDEKPATVKWGLWRNASRCHAVYFHHWLCCHDSYHLSNCQTDVNTNIVFKAREWSEGGHTRSILISEAWFWYWGEAEQPCQDLSTLRSPHWVIFPWKDQTLIDREPFKDVLRQITLYLQVC